MFQAFWFCLGSFVLVKSKYNGTVLSLLLRYRSVPTRMPRCDYRQLCYHTNSFAYPHRLDVLFNSEVTNSSPENIPLSFFFVCLLGVKDSLCLILLSAKQLGPVLKLFICLCLSAAIILWPILGVLASVLGGALYGFLSPIFATFDAVGEGKSSPLLHCFCDGTWSTVKRSFIVVRDFRDVCFHSYFSLMDEIRRCCPDKNYHEIRYMFMLLLWVWTYLSIELTRHGHSVLGFGSAIFESGPKDLELTCDVCSDL